MTIEQLETEMTDEEFNTWMKYFNQRPLGWREDMRTYRIMQAFGTKEKPEALFDSLATVLGDSKKSDNPMDSFKGSQLFNKLLNATGGDKIF